MTKMMIVDPENCTGCRICELVCSYQRKGMYAPSESLIKVLKNEEMNVYVPVLKMGCLGTSSKCNKCVTACPTRALEFVETEKAALLRKNSNIGKFPTLLIRG